MDKPRVMYVVECYPAITETYIQSEIDALRDDYEIRIVALHSAEYPNQSHHPSFEIANPAGMRKAIEEFDPHVLHTHWLVNVPLLEALARSTSVPFTVRAHSFDGIWNETEATPPWIAKVTSVLNSNLCLGVIGFPFMRANFVRAGIQNERIRDCYPPVNFERFHDRSPNGRAVLTGGAGRASKQMEDFLALAAMMPDMDFNLYAVGRQTEKLQQLNVRSGGLVKIRAPVQPAAMPAEYKKHGWLVETAALEPNARGWPIMVAEAQASGVGVCMRNIRPDLKEYVGECGFIYNSIEEAKAIISQPFPEELRQMGFEHARKSDIQQHKYVLTDLWQMGFAKSRPKATRRSGMKPAVSIILPTFNRAGTLKRAVDSVLRQTFTDFELIIVDDGSTDETTEVLNALRDHRQIQIISQSRRGCAKARNVGLSCSRGRYIAFQDSDDEWLPHKLEKSINMMEASEPNVGVFYSDMLYINADGSSSYFQSPDITRGILIDEERLDYQVNMIGIVSALIRRECFDKAGDFDESLTRFSDLELFIRLSDHFDFVHCKEPLVRYYSGNGVSADSEALVLARRYLMNKYRQRLEQHQHHLAGQHLHLEIDRLSSEIAKLTRSRSWRLLRSLNRIRNRFRKKR